MMKRRKARRKKRSRRSATEYFLAAAGLAIIAFIIAMAVSFRSCQFHVPGLVPSTAATPTQVPPSN